MTSPYELEPRDEAVPSRAASHADAHAIPDPAPASWSERLGDWLGLIRFSHTIFALPFAALATVMALSTPLASGELPRLRPQDLLGILLCMVFARSAAMAFNRLVDQNFDAANPRTANRHLPAGRLRRRWVWMFTAGTCGGFFASTLLFLPNAAPLAAALPVLAFVLGYSLAKQFTSASHVWLGLALSLAPICAWVAIRGFDLSQYPSDLLIPVVLAVVVAAWVTGFDVIYACQDAEFDAQVGLHSVPAKFGIAGALQIAALCHFIMIGLLALFAYVGLAAGLGKLFAAAVAVTSILVVIQHRLVRPDDLTRVNQAFFNTNAAISLILFAAGTIDCLVV